MDVATMSFAMDMMLLMVDAKLKSCTVDKMLSWLMMNIGKWMAHNPTHPQKLQSKSTVFRNMF